MTDPLYLTALEEALDEARRRQEQAQMELDAVLYVRTAAAILGAVALIVLLSIAVGGDSSVTMVVTLGIAAVMVCLDFACGPRVDKARLKVANTQEGVWQAERMLRIASS